MPHLAHAALLVALTATLLVPTAASAFRLELPLERALHSPVDRWPSRTIDDPAYDPARRCTPGANRVGTKRFVRWLITRRPRGAFWGTYRCERWGEGSASLHAEKRAVDWHLDTRDPADRAEARKLIGQLLAPDRAGNPHALARRMGVQAILWDCSWWSSGMEQFSRYRPCFGRDGTPRRRVSRTTAHRDHIHFELSVRGAAGRTSYWRRTR